MAPTPESVLIIKMSSFGDIVCALPTLRALRRSRPSPRIGWVVDERFRELVEQDPDIDEVFAVDLRLIKSAARSPRRFRDACAQIACLRARLRAARFAVSLDLQGLLKSGVVSRLAGCPRNVQMAADHLRRLQLLFPGERCVEGGLHAVDRMLPLAAACGADIATPTFGFHIPPAARDHAAELLAGISSNGSPIVALNPTASARHRVWPPERYAELLRRIHRELGVCGIVLGGPADVETSHTIVAQSGVPALTTAGKTGYLQLAAVLDSCDVLVSSDTGPQHLAAALGKPVVALFGPSVPERTGPYGEGHTIIHHQLPCYPCYSHPTCRDSACMRAITVDEVLQAVAGKL